MNYLLDTNIVLIYTRESPLTKLIDNDYDLFSGRHNLFISVVTVGELESIILQRNYGEKKINNLNRLFSNFSIIDINIQEVIARYGKIDAYSQGKLRGKSSSFSARNMGKNDLWIAATSSVYDLVLITTDSDFDHLESEFINLEKVNTEDYKNK